MISSQKLVKDHMAGLSPERIGLYDRIWTDTLANWVEYEGYPVDESGQAVDPHQHFGFDLVQVGGGFDALPIRGHSETVAESDEWIALRNGAGANLPELNQPIAVGPPFTRAAAPRFDGPERQPTL